MAITERLELELDDALNSISKIDDSLSSVTQSFSDQMLKALEAAANARVELTDVDVSALDSTIAEALAGAGDIPVVVEADATAIPDEIGAVLDDVLGVVPVDADASGIAPEIDAAIADADTTVDVELEVDDSGLDELTSSVGGLGAVAEGSAGGLSQLEGAAAGFTGAAALAQGQADPLLAALGKIGPGGLVAASGLAAAAGATALLFDKALDARAAQERLNIVFGDQAAAIQRLDIGGLTGDLGDLAVSIGSDDEALRNATSSLGQFGQTSQASAPLIKTTVQQVDALALRAAALNPALGEAGDIAEALGPALARGGRATAQFGISLSSVDINARAAKLALADGRDEVSQFDKVAAGAQITTETLGKKLGTDFREGSQQASIQLKALKQSLDETLEAAGAPLVDPLLDAFRELTPVAQELGTSLGDVLAAIVPVATDIAVDLAPAAQGAAEAVGLLAVPLHLVADVLDIIPDPAKEAAGAILALNLALNSATATRFATALGLSTAAAETATAANAALVTSQEAVASTGLASVLGLGRFAGLATTAGTAMAGLGEGLAGTALGLAALNPELAALAIADIVAPVRNYAAEWDKATDAQARNFVEQATNGRTVAQGVDYLREHLVKVNDEIRNQRDLIDRLGTSDTLGLVSNFFATEASDGEKAHDVLERLEQRHDGLKKALDVLTIAEGKHKTAAESAADAVRNAIQAEQASQQATLDLKNEILGLNDALRSVPNAQVTAERASLATADAFDALTKAKAAGRQEDESAEEFLRRVRGLELDYQSAILAQAAAQDAVAKAADASKTAIELYNTAVKDPAARAAVIAQLEATKQGLGPEAVAIIQGYIDKLNTLPPAATAAGVGTGTGFGAGAKLGVALTQGGLNAQAVSLFADVAIAASQGAALAGASLGEAFGSGFEVGIVDSVTGVEDSINNAIDSAIAAVRTHIDSHSPSRLTASLIGEPIIEGVALGIDRRGGTVADSLNSVLDDAVGSAAINLGGIFDGKAQLAVNVVPVIPSVAVSSTIAAGVQPTSSRPPRTEDEILDIVRRAVAEGGVNVDGPLIENHTTELQDANQVARKLAYQLGRF